jgi:soluble lytic murein transglycosylase
MNKIKILSLLATFSFITNHNAYANNSTQIKNTISLQKITTTSASQEAQKKLISAIKQQNNESIKMNYQIDKKLIGTNYLLIKKGLWHEAIKRSDSRAMKSFFEMLRFSKIKEKKDSYDELLMYRFLSQKYQSISNIKIENSIKKAQSYSVEIIDDSLQSPAKLLAQYDKNYNCLEQSFFQKKVKTAWHTGKFITPTEENHFLRTFSSILTKEDHSIRLEGLLWSGSSDAAKRILHEVDTHTRIKARDRIDIQSSKTVEELFKKLNKLTQNDYNNQVLLFDALSWCKKNKMHDEIFTLLDIIPTKNRIQNNQWWELLRSEIRDLLKARNAKNYKLAYKIASTHGLSNKKIEYSEAEFLAGFVAFNFLKNYDEAIKHFSNSYHFTKQDFRKARASYWLGVTYEKFDAHSINNKATKTNATKNYQIFSHQAFTKCSGHFTTFYGQLCLKKLNNLESIKNKLVIISEQDIQHTILKPLFKYYYYCLLTGDVNLVKKIAKIITLTSKSKNEVAVLAGIANHLQMPDISIYIGNIALYNMNFLVLEALYPTPNYKHMIFNKLLNLSLIKRESNFEQNAKSVSNANGLMQIIPTTGIDIAKTIGIEYSQKALLNPETNVLLGNTFLKYLNDKFDNSLILTTAAYNSGSGSVSKWIKEIGDIKNEKSLNSKVIWIEQIPFRETRYYVQSIISNMTIYQAILNSNQKLDKIFDELN